MNANLDSVKTEAENYLNENGFILFRGYSRALDDIPEIEWDTAHYPDVRMFLDVAKKLGVKLAVMHHREFDSEVIDMAIDRLTTGGFDFEEQTQVETRLRELTMYDGFTCQLEVSFDFDGIMYIFELRAPWFMEFSNLMDELDLAGEDDEDEDEDSYGGYYSKN